MFRVLLIGVEPLCRASIEKALGFADLIEGPSKVQDLPNHLVSPPPNLILCSRPSDNRTPEEYAQGLKMIYQKVPLVYLTADKTGFDRADFVKNGFDDAFLLPFEAKEFEQKVQGIAAPAEDDHRLYRPIQLYDLKPGIVLDFDVYLYLPVNDKFLRLSAANKALPEQQFQKLQKYFVNSLFIKISDLNKFYKFTAKQLAGYTKRDRVSGTERQERLEGAIRSIVSGLFTESAEDASEEQGQRILQDCSEIVKSYFEASNGKPGGVFEKMQKISGFGSGSYSHSAHAATLVSMFAIGLEIGKPEQIAIAGLLHDIGIAELPPEIQAKSVEDMTPEELKIYQTHPQLAVDIITKHKIAIPEEVKTIILQHHENCDGTGYPRGVSGMDFMPEAQLLGIADLFIDLTETKPGKKRITPQQAMDAILGQSDKIDTGRNFDPLILSRLRKLLFDEENEASKAKAS